VRASSLARSCRPWMACPFPWLRRRSGREFPTTGCVKLLQADGPGQWRCAHLLPDNSLAGRLALHMTPQQPGSRH